MKITVGKHLSTHKLREIENSAIYSKKEIARARAILLMRGEVIKK